LTEHSTDIEFDFFDEPETVEQTQRVRQPRRPGGNGDGPPRRPMRPPTGFTPLLRLVGAVAMAIAIVVFLVLWGQSCRSEGERNAYEGYMTSMRQIAQDSERVGRELNVALTTPGTGLQDLQQAIAGLAQQQEQGVARARELRPPGRLREAHQQAIESLQFRVSGLRRLEDAFGQSANLPEAAAAGALLAEQMQRLVTSDIVWVDLFKDPSVAVLRAEDIGGVEVPDSVFVANADLASAGAMTPVWTRINGASTGGEPGGLHGNSLVSTKALPGGAVLTTGDENVVRASADLAFEVTIENSGDAQEVQVGVTLTIQQSPRPIVKKATVDIINPGERKTVVFRELGQAVQFAQKTSVKVEVEPVPGEENLSNNSATYPVIFSLT
jgi:hypothetical protein